MANRHTMKDKKTLRTVLAENFQEVVKAHGKVAEARFPHTSYGQDPESETFKKSFPLSYKRYFFRLVKNIIMGKSGKKTIIKSPPSLLMTIGARTTTKIDPLIKPSLNTRLQAYKLGKLHDKFKKQPDAFRSRVFRRTDKEAKLEKVFMQFSEVENCKFEPELGALNPNAKKESEEVVPGEFFNKLGVNFATRNPRIYKQGVLKKAKLYFKNGKIEESYKELFHGFNVPRVLANFREKEFKAWKNMFDIESGKNTGKVTALTDEMKKRYDESGVKNKPWLTELFEDCVKISEQEIKDHPQKKAVFAEVFDNPSLKAMYDECNALLNMHIQKRYEAWKEKERKKKQGETLKHEKKTLKQQIEEGFDDAGEGADGFDTEKDYRKIYKTIMCPLKDQCQKVKMQRWPSSGLKSITKFGKDCPYAHHPMELQFPETLDMRIAANNKKMKPHEK